MPAVSYFEGMTAGRPNLLLLYSRCSQAAAFLCPSLPPPVCFFCLCFLRPSPILTVAASHSCLTTNPHTSRSNRHKPILQSAAASPCLPRLKGRGASSLYLPDLNSSTAPPVACQHVAPHALSGSWVQQQLRNTYTKLIAKQVQTQLQRAAAKSNKNR